MRHLLLVFLLLMSTKGFAADDPRAADHQALRELLVTVTTALNEQRYDDIGAHLNSDCTITFIDQGVVRNAEEMKTYFAKWFAPDTTLKSVRFAPTIDKPATFYVGDNAFATGTSDDFYTLKDGRSATMPSRWTAVLTKREGAWKLIALHFSVNPMDNVVLTAAVDVAKDLAIKSGLIAGLIALLIGLVVGLKMRRKSA